MIVSTTDGINDTLNNNENMGHNKSIRLNGLMIICSTLKAYFNHTFDDGWGDD